MVQFACEPGSFGGGFLSILIALLSVFSSVPNVVVAGGERCAAGASNVVVVDVRAADPALRALEFRVRVFSGLMDISGFVMTGDESKVVLDGKGRARIELPRLSDSEKKLAAQEWVVCRSVQISVGGRLASIVGVEVERKGGQCVFVRM